MVGDEANDAVMGGNLLIDFLNTLPPFLWFSFLLYLLVRYRRQIERLFRRLTTFKGMGVEFEFAEASLDDAAEARAQYLEADALEHGAKADAAHRIEVPEPDRKRALDWALANFDLLEDRRILWVDDIPSNNRNERCMFRSLGIASEATVSTEEALNRLGRDEAQFDLIISDMTRNGDNQAGLKLIADYSALATQLDRAPDDRLPVIFYLGNFNPTKGTPAGAFGITNRPDQLLHLVVAALAQTKR